MQRERKNIEWVTFKHLLMARYMKSSTVNDLYVCSSAEWNVYVWR